MSIVKTVKIFISSTFRDMNAERDVLIGDVFPRLREMAETELGLRIREIDLRWGITEQQAARGEVIDLCLDGIEESRPYFLGLLGKRYGWIPAPPYIRRSEFESVLASATKPDDRDLLLRAYSLASPDAQVYQLAPGVSNADKNRARDTLAAAGIREAGMSITEQEIDQVLSDRALPRLIPDLDKLVAGVISAGDQEILNRHYVPEGADRLWRLQPGASDDDEQVLLELLDRLGWHREFHSFFLFRDDIGESHPDYAETDCRLVEKLDELKRRIVSSDKPEAIVTYPCEWHEECLGDPEQHAIQELTEFSEIAFNLLWNHIQQNVELLAGTTGEQTDLEQEREAHSRFIDRRTHSFRGREELLTELELEIDAALHGRSGSAAESGHMVMVVGEPGSGKSALLAKIVERLLHSGRQETEALVLPWFVGASERSAVPRHILNHWCKVLSSEFGIDVEIPPDVPELREAFRYCLKEADRPVVIILDGIDQLRSDDIAGNIQWLPKDLPANVCILTSLAVDPGPVDSSAAVASAVLEAMRRRVVPPIEVLIPRLSEDEQTEILRSYLRQYNKHLLPAQLQTLISKTESHSPLYLQAAAEELRIVSRHEDVGRVVEDLPQTTTDIFAYILQRVENQLAQRLGDSAKDLFRSFMTYVATGRGGMAEDDLRLLLGNWRQVGKLPPERVRLSDFHWGGLRRSLRPYLFLRGERWAFFHGQLMAAVTSRYLATGDRQLTAHRTVAEYLETMGYEHATTLQDLPYHLTLASRQSQLDDGEDTRQKLCSVLTDIKFVEAKSRNGMVYDLVADYSDAMGVCASLAAAAMEAWRHFVRNHAAQLSCDDSPALQFAYNSADGGPVADRMQELLDGGVGVVGPWFRLRNRPAFASRPACLNVLAKHTGHVTAVAATPDGRWVATGGADHQVRVWDLSSGEQTVLLSGHTDSLRATAISSDGRRVVSGGRDRTIRVWDPTTGACVKILEGHGGTVTSLAVTGDGRSAISGSVDREVRLWDLVTGQCVAVLRGHSGRVRAVSMTPNGHRAVSAGDDKVVCFWNLLTRKKLVGLGGHTGRCTAVSLTPDGRWAVSGSYDQSVRLWDLESGECRQVMTGHDGRVDAVAIDASGKQAVSGGSDQALHLWDLDSGTCVRTFEGHSKGICSVSVTDDGQRALSGSDDCTVRVWDLGSNLPAGSPHDHASEAWAVALSADGRRAVSGMGDGSACIWNWQSGKRHTTLTGHSDKVKAAAISADGRVALTGSHDGSMRLWDAESGECLNVLTGHSGRVRAVAISADGKLAISGGKDRTVRVWDSRTGRCSRLLEGHRDRVRAVALTPDCRLAISGSTDATVRVWDLGTGQCLNTLSGHDGRVRAVALSDDGRYGVSGGYDGTVRVWDLGTGDCTAVLRHRCSWVNSVSFAADARHVVSGSEDGSVRLWQLRSDDPAGMVHVKGLLSVSAVSAAGRIACSTASGAVLFFELCNVL